MLDAFPDTAGAGLVLRAAQSLDAGDLPAAQSSVSQILTWPVGDPYGISLIMTLVLTAADAGYFDQALAWTQSCGFWAMRCVSSSFSRRTVGDPRIHRRPKARPARPAAQENAHLADSPPWPAVVHGRLLWWPEAEYPRLVAQVPDVLGATWRQYAAKVESTLRAFRRLQP